MAMVSHLEEFSSFLPSCSSEESLKGEEQDSSSHSLIMRNELDNLIAASAADKTSLYSVSDGVNLLIGTLLFRIFQVK